MKGFLSGFKEGMAAFGELVATVVNTVLLSIVYAIGVGMTKVIALVQGRRLLEKELGEESYWEDLKIKEGDDSYYRMF